jgi:hypothetical protein
LVFVGTIVYKKMPPRDFLQNRWLRKPLLHGVCHPVYRNTILMNHYEKLKRYELLDLLAYYTRRSFQILLKGETYTGEYKKCKESLERIYRQFLRKERKYGSKKRQ